MQERLEPLIYSVVVVRTDMELAFYQTDVLDEAVKAQKALDEEWVTCVKEQRPFRLPAVIETAFNSPVLTSFSPNLLREIKIMKMTLSDYERSKSPYDRQVQQGGMSDFMSKNFQKRG